MLETKYVDDNFKMLVMVLAITIFLNKRRALTSKFCHQHPKIVTIIKSPTSLSPPSKISTKSYLGVSISTVVVKVEAEAMLVVVDIISIALSKDPCTRARRS